MATVQVGTKVRQFPLTGLTPGVVSRTQQHEIYVKEKWSDPDWIVVNYAYATHDVTRAIPQRSTAEIVFDFGRIKREDSDVWDIFNRDTGLRDVFVAIKVYPGSPGRRGSRGGGQVLATTLWVGVIPAEQITVDGRATHDPTTPEHFTGQQVMQATGFEYLLERRRVIGAVRDHVPVTGELMPPGFDRLGTTPVFNGRHTDGTTTGNRSANKLIYSNGDTASFGFSDARAGSVPYAWGLADMLEYMLYWSHEPDDDPTADEPRFELDRNAVVTFLGNLFEMVDTNNRSVWNLMSLIFTRRRGVLAYFAYIFDDENLPTTDPVLIIPFSMSDQDVVVGNISLPKNNSKSIVKIDEGIDFANAVVVLDTLNTYDEVVVQGAKAVSVFSARTGTYLQEIPEVAALTNPVPARKYAKIVPAWTPAQQTQFENDPIGRDSNTTLDKVFREFKLAGLNELYFDWKVALATALDSNGQRLTLNPAFDTLAQPLFDVASGFLNVDKKIKADVPIIQLDDVDSETVEPAFMKLAVFLEVIPVGPAVFVGGSILSTVFFDIWMEASHPPPIKSLRALLQAELDANAFGSIYKMNPSVDVAFTVTPSSTDLTFKVSGAKNKHALAFNHINDLTAAKIPRNETSYDYDRMVVTMAVETDTRPAVRIKLNSNQSGRYKTRRLVIVREDVQFWFTTGDVAIGVSDKGKLLHYGGNRVLRDDTDVLRSLAALAAAWYAKDRAAVTVTRHGLLSGAVLGTFLEAKIKNPTQSTPIGIATPVTEVAHDYGEQTTTITTGLVEVDIRSAF